MKITLNIVVKEGRIIADSPETGFHEDVANVLLFEQEQKKIAGIGTTLEEAERDHPQAYAQKKHTLMVVPGYSSTEFQGDSFYFLIRYLSTSACLNKRNFFLTSLHSLDRLCLNFTLPGYEQVPKPKRERFEHQILTKTLGTCRKVRQLMINNREIHKPHG